MANSDHAGPRRNGHRWHPIEDLPPGLQRSEELRTLFELWRSQRDKLAQANKLAEFSERLIRAWCIETGILGDHCEAIDGLFAFEGNRELSTAYVKALHHAMTGRQDECEETDSLGQLLRGEWRRVPDNPVDPASGVALHEYCPSEQLAIEMDNLMRMHREHGQIAPEIAAAWLHHRCTQIHPFRDGNERVAGTLATLVFLRAGGFPLVVRATDRSEYVGALERADDGDLQPLIALFARLQRFGILGALALGQQVLAEATSMPAIVRSAPFRIRDALLEPARAVATAAARLSDPPTAAEARPTLDACSSSRNEECAAHDVAGAGSARRCGLRFALSAVGNHRRLEGLLPRLVGLRWQRGSALVPTLAALSREVAVQCREVALGQPHWSSVIDTAPARAGPVRPGPPMNHRLHIGNLSAHTTAASLTEAFQRDGRTVARVQLVMSRDPGRSRGFAFVDMATGAEAGAAITALHGTDIDGRTVRVTIAHEPKSQFGGTAGGLRANPMAGKP